MTVRHTPEGDTASIGILSFAQALEKEASAEGYDVTKWIYLPSSYGEYRYVLGTRGEKPLFCIGVNPSTAAPGRLDPTLKSVERVALGNGYDSFLMFNLYAQRATDPSDMERAFNGLLHTYNVEAFSYMLSLCKEPPDVWAAWGTLVEKRDYLPGCVRAFADAAAPFGARWFTFGARSKSGHPHHPLYLKKDCAPEPFDVFAYLESLKGREGSP